LIAEFLNDPEVARSVLESDDLKKWFNLIKQISTPTTEAEWSNSVYDIIKKGNLIKV